MTKTIIQSSAPLPKSFSGYWTFVTSAVLILLLMYLASNSQLGKWLALFSYSDPATPNLVQSGVQQAGGGVVQQAQGALNQLGGQAVAGVAQAVGVPQATAQGIGQNASIIAGFTQAFNPLTAGMKILNGALGVK
jgi:hypothetical protein